MKLKNLFVLTIAVVFTACQSNTLNANIQNAQPSPTVAVQTLPTNSSVDNVVSPNAPYGNTKSNQTIASPSPTVSPTPKPSVTPIVSALPKYKNYTVKGVVKGIDVEKSSIVIDHEDIGDYMVAMEMPFPVTDKNILKNVKIGDKVEFVLETGVGVERIIKIRKK